MGTDRPRRAEKLSVKDGLAVVGGDVLLRAGHNRQVQAGLDERTTSAE
ncbi:hypothetical protein ACFVH0_17255 [Streptomyces sp. NPDC127117]